MARYSWVRIPADLVNPAIIDLAQQAYSNPYPDRLWNVGINADGSLHNPHNYPEDLVRTAVLAANAQRRAQERSRQESRRNPTRAVKGEGPHHRPTHCEQPGLRSAPSLLRLRARSRGSAVTRNAGRACSTRLHQ